MKKILILLLVIPFLGFSQDSESKFKKELKKTLKFSTIFAAINGGTSLADKNTYSVNSSHAASSPLVLPGVNFGDASFDPSAIDLYVNGALMSSGSSEDYTLQSGVTGSVLFAFKLMPEDTITTLLLK